MAHGDIYDGRGAPPAAVPLGVYHIGPLVLVALPGEFTTVLGRRISTAVAEGPGGGSEQIVRVVGLAGGYAYYFTTPEEYDAQQYEGSGTFWGRAAGTVMVDRFRHLATTIEEPSPGWSARRFVHRCGIRCRFEATAVCSDPTITHTDGTIHILTPDPSDPPVALPGLTWEDAVPSLDGRSTPHVRIEVLGTNGSWLLLLVNGFAQDDDGDRFVVRFGKHDGKHTWHALWLPPRGVDMGGTYRFRIIGIDGSERTGKPFALEPATQTVGR